jgi:hypothetical protein
MKTFIVYVDGMEKGYINARNHNSAERKAKDKYGTVNHSEVEQYMRMHPDVTHADARDRLIDRCTNVSVAYTEI